MRGETGRGGVADGHGRDDAGGLSERFGSLQHVGDGFLVLVHSNGAVVGLNATSHGGGRRRRVGGVRVEVLGVLFRFGRRVFSAVGEGAHREFNWETFIDLGARFPALVKIGREDVVETAAVRDHHDHVPGDLRFLALGGGVGERGAAAQDETQ